MSRYQYPFHLKHLHMYTLKQSFIFSSLSQSLSHTDGYIPKTVFNNRHIRQFTPLSHPLLTLRVAQK